MSEYEIMLLVVGYLRMMTLQCLAVNGPRLAVFSKETVKPLQL